jgi:hypothetical protein
MKGVLLHRCKKLLCRTSEHRHLEDMKRLQNSFLSLPQLSDDKKIAKRAFYLLREATEGRPKAGAEGTERQRTP